MAHRHKVHRAAGGRTYYSGGESNVAKEAKEKKGGGAVQRKHGGKVSRRRLDKRARGGGVGADKNPFSSASQKTDRRTSTKEKPHPGGQ